jgi:hypothetical protein
MENKILIAGFGGQGVLFLGKLIAYSGLIGNMEVSWGLKITVWLTCVQQLYLEVCS